MTALYQVNAFTAVPFAGNPAGVVLLDAPRPDDWMRHVSAELNLAETAFLRELPDGQRELRWFTPTVEVPLCGHATLATAHVLWETGAAAPEETLGFSTQSGEVSARRDGDAIVLDFPAYELHDEELPPALRDLVGAPVRGAVLLDDLAGDATWLVELRDEAAVRAYTADDRALLATGFGGLVLTARADAATGTDIVSRCFFPGAGISEDPVTGAAHCALAPYWAPRLGRAELSGHQASARGGVVGMRLAGDRVELRGQAVTVFTGALRV